MSSRPRPLLRSVFVGAAAFCAAAPARAGAGVSAAPSAATAPASPPSPSSTSSAAALRGPDTDHSYVTRFLEARVGRDPDDIVAWNRLAGLYLQRVRETGDVDYLQLANRAALKSLAAVAEPQNPGGLAMRARAEYESHDFATALASARRLVDLAPDKASSFALLGDALIELGDYDGASAAYEKMRAIDDGGFGVLARLGRVDQLRGRTDAARQKFAAALAAAASVTDTPPEAVAWCRWQAAELDFSAGDYAASERHAREALRDFPGYYRALAALGRTRAAQGDLAGAIEEYRHAVAVLPDPTFLAALGDLYAVTGRDKEAKQQYVLVKQVAKLTALRGVLYNRSLALFRADHDRETAEAYEDARREYAVRKDVFGADAVAWTALKAGNLPEARASAKEALRLGTQDPRLFYHVGMVALAGAEYAGAEDYLGRALALSPHFDPLQAPLCAKALETAKGATGEKIPHPR